MPQYVTPHDLAQAVLAYLAQRPYREVAQLIAALERMEKLTPPPAREAGAS